MMDYHVKEYFSHSSDDAPKGNFHRVIALHEAPDIDWESIQEIVPDFCRGWYELAQLSSKDRIEFIRDYWIGKLPYRQGVSENILQFFENLDDIGVYITQKVYDSPYESYLVYCLKGDSGFYKGCPSASEQELSNMQKQFPGFILPRDYLAFLLVHNGFSKTTDYTGIISTGKLIERYSEFQEMLSKEDIIKSSSGVEIDPKSLIPFYESFGMPFFQCFWTDWYPEEEMGNVYYSGQTKTVLFDQSGSPSVENMSFPTFLDWLMFYLERIE